MNSGIYLKYDTYDPLRPPKWAPMYNPMEYVCLRTEKRSADGTVMVLQRSIIHKDAPERKGFTRSEIDVSGFVLRPCGTNSTVVIYTSQAMLKGAPKWAEAKVLNARALLPHKIRKFVEKELKETTKDKKKVVAWKQPGLW